MKMIIEMPRAAYLLAKDNDYPDFSCRGGVCGTDKCIDEYVLEIGQMQNCDPEMLSLAAHVDEIRTLLSWMAKEDAVARMVLTSWNNLTKELKDKLFERYERRKEKEKDAQRETAGRKAEAQNKAIHNEQS